MTTDATFWSRLSRRYAAMPVGNPDAYARTLARTRTHLHPGDRVLELGCGTASTALALAPSVAEYVATDYAEGMVAIGREKLARAGLANLDVRCAGPGDGSLPPGPWDAVLAFNLLHLLPDLPAALAEVHGLLRPRGLLISKTPCLGGVWQMLRPLVAAMRLAGKAPAVRYLTPARLERALQRAGFEIVERCDDPARPPRRFVVARRL